MNLTDRNAGVSIERHQQKQPVVVNNLPGSGFNSTSMVGEFLIGQDLLESHRERFLARQEWSQPSEKSPNNDNRFSVTLHVAEQDVDKNTVYSRA